MTWTLTGAVPTWLDEHPAEPGSTRNALFENDVLLLFDEGHPEAEVDARQAQAVHTRTVTLKADLSAIIAPDQP